MWCRVPFHGSSSLDGKSMLETVFATRWRPLVSRSLKSAGESPTTAKTRLSELAAAVGASVRTGRKWIAW